MISSGHDIICMMKYPEIDPVALHLGPLSIHWYGLSYLAGFFCVWCLLRLRAESRSPDQIADLVFYGALGAVLGGRIGYVLFYNFDYFLLHPLSLIRIWEGGMSFHGGLIGVLLAMFWFSRKLGQGFFEMTDFLVPAVPVGLFFGRIANFINGELWGAPSSLPWAMVFPEPRAEGLLRHPSQLYEALLEGLVLFVILWVYSSRPRPVRAVTGLFLTGYGMFRFIIEFVREPDAHIGYLAFGWFTQGQLLSLPMIIIGGALFVLACNKEKLREKV